MMTTRRIFIATVVVAASAIALGVQTRATEPEAQALDNTEWTLTEIEGAAPLSGRGELDLQFSETGSFGISFGCNRFRGQVEVEGTQLSFPDQIAGTMMACPEDLAAQEERGLALLAEVASYRIDPGVLNLLDAEGSTLLLYRDAREEPEAMVETGG